MYAIRPLTAADLDALKAMFYVSLYVPEGDPPFPRSIIEKPGLARYYQDWGRESDLGLLVEAFGEPVGATWSRFFPATDPGYGFVNEDTPEIGIALLENHRGKGIGTALLSRLCRELEWRNVPSVSLSVDRRNRAINLYQRLGFQIYQQEGDAIIMLKKI